MVLLVPNLNNGVAARMKLHANSKPHLVPFGWDKLCRPYGYPAVSFPVPNDFLDHIFQFIRLPFHEGIIAQ